MPADRSDDPGGPPDPPDRPGAYGALAETRSRQEYYDDLRHTVSAERSRTATREQAAAARWDKTAEESGQMWSEYQRRWPAVGRPPPGTTAGPPGCWHGEGNRSLDRADNARVDAACDRISARERDTITPAMRAAETQDPDRHLTGLEHCLKGRDRIKEKIHRSIKNFGRSPEQAVSHVPDTIRYTFQYKEAGYTQGVRADIERLKEQGFELRRLRNSWTEEQYKGINSQWIEPGSGQRFEVQFHTRISFEAKQLTHGAYERLRTMPSDKADKFEQMVLEAFQKKVTAEVPAPPGAVGIPDYPQGGADAR